MVAKIFSCISALNKQRLTVLLVEQNANIALGVSDVGHVIATVELSASGTGSALLQVNRVRKAYLGEE